MHFTRRAFSRAVERAGNKSAARIAMIAMTTSSSINVKATTLVGFVCFFFTLLLTLTFSVLPSEVGIWSFSGCWMLEFGFWLSDIDAEGGIAHTAANT